jgi:hypothetical protein
VTLRSDGLVLAATLVEAQAPTACALIIVGGGRDELVVGRGDHEAGCSRIGGLR